MKTIRLFLAVFLLSFAALPQDVWAALASATVWEVRTTGSDTNGGGFVAGSSGTDWSQQASPQYAVTDGVTAGTTTITSATANWGTDVVGNVAYVAGGTGSVVAGWYQITARTDAQTITVDRATGLTAGTGVTVRVGGALATIGQLATNMVAQNKAFIKADGTYTTTATITFPNGSATTTKTVVTGYTSSRGDSGRATLQMLTNTGFYGITVSGSGVIVKNLTIDANSLTGSGGITSTGNYNVIYNCKVLNYQGIGINSSSSLTVVYGNEVTAGISGATSGITSTGGSPILFNYVHDGVGGGINTTSTSPIVRNIVANQSGATSDGIAVSQGIALYNTVYNSGRHGIYNSTNVWYVFVAVGNVLVNNGGYGMAGSVSTQPATAFYDGNAYFNNTSGTRLLLDNTSAQNGVAPYTNTFDVILSGNPFVSAGTGDFGLNNNVGAGAACRGAGVPVSYPGATSTAHPDMGAVQHLDPGPSIQIPNFAY